MKRETGPSRHQSLAEQAQALRQEAGSGPGVKPQHVGVPDAKKSRRPSSSRAVGKAFGVVFGIIIIVVLALVLVPQFLRPNPDEAEYRQQLLNEIDEYQPQLPSACERMITMWQQYLDRSPASSFVDAARDKRDRWKVKLQKEIQRGFRIVIEEAEIKSVKGPSHTEYAGRPWDPELLGGSAAPDAYVLVKMQDQVIAASDKVQDSFHPAWQFDVGVVHVSDLENLTILVRERDVGRSMQSFNANMGTAKAVGTMMGMQMALPLELQLIATVLGQDNDDNICEWTGTIRDLISRDGGSVVLQAGDCERLLVRVTRP